MSDVACVTSFECGAQKCIEGRCTTVEAILEARRERERAWHAQPEFESLYGNGRGYVAAILAADIVATTTALVEWSLFYVADPDRAREGFQWLALSQLVAGSTIHFAHHRLVFGVSSLIGWSAVSLQAYFVPQAINPRNDDGAGLAAGLAFALSGAVGMTIADALMARTAPQPAGNGGAWTPMFSPTRGGAIGVLGRTW